MGGMPLLCQGEHLSPTRQAYVPARYRTRKLLIAKRIHYPLHHRDCVTMDSRGGVIDSVFAKQSSGRVRNPAVTYACCVGEKCSS